MSKERMNDPAMTPELMELESSLRGFSAGRTVHREEVLFEAGRQSATLESAGRKRCRQFLSIALSGLLLGQSIGKQSAEQDQLARSDSAPSHTISSAESPDPKPDAVNRKSPGRQPGKVTSMAKISGRRTELLSLRRVELTRVIDAAFSSSTDENVEAIETNSSQQHLLLEMLGS